MVELQTSTNEIADNIKEIAKLLETPALLSETEKAYIQKFLSNGLFLFGIEYHGSNPELAEPMMNICRAIIEGQERIVDPGRALGIKNKFITKLQKVLRSGFAVDDDKYIKLAEIYASNLFLVDPSSLDHLMEIMIPGEYKASKVFNYLMQSLDEVLAKELTTKYYEDFLYKYVDMHILNEEEFDFKNDEVIKRFPPSHVQIVEDEYRIKKELFNLMQMPAEKLSTEDLLKLSSGVVNILQYSSYSVLDKQLLQDFIDNGFYTNPKLILNINGANNMEKIIHLIRTNEQVKKNISGDVLLSDRYEILKFFAAYKGALKQALIEDEGNIPKDEFIELAKIYGKEVKAPSLKVIGKARDKMTPLEFWNSDLYRYAETRFRDEVTERNDSSVWSNSEYISFAFEYVEYLKKNGGQIDYDNDPILVNTKKINPEALRVQEILMSNGRIKPTEKDIYYINQYIEVLLISEYDNPNKTLSEVEKSYISNYMKRYLSYSIRNIEDHDEVLPIINYLSKIRANTTLSGKADDKAFFNGVIPDDFTRVIATRMRLGTDNAHMTNDELETILYLVAADNIYDTDVFIQGMKNLQDRNVDIERSMAMKKYVESFANQYTIIEPQSMTEDERPVYEIIYDYVDMITRDRDSFNIFEEQGISDILQLVNKKKLPQEQSDMIYGILENNLQISRYNVVRDKQFAAKFAEKYKDRPCRSEAEFDRFLGYLQRIKLAERRPISLKYCKNIIRQTLQEGSIIRNNPEKYAEVVSRAIEDLSNGLGMRYQDTTYFIRQELNTTGAFGEQRDRDIRLSKTGIAKFVHRKDISCLETLFHENTHQEQDYDSQRGKYGQYIRYITEKEKIIRSYNEKYYVDNYQYMYCEIEAREKGNSKLIEFLKSLGMDLDSSFIFHSFITREIEKVLSERAEKEKDNYKAGEEKLISDTDFSGREKVTTYFDSLVKKNPIILKQHPILMLEYNKNGDLRSFADVVQDMEASRDETDTLLLYRDIIGKGNIIRPETIADTLLYLCNYRTASLRMGASINSIIRDNVARVLDDTVDTLDTMPTQDIYKLKSALERTISKEVLERNPLLKRGLKRAGTDSDKNGLEAIEETLDVIDVVLALRRNEPIDWDKYPKTVRQYAFNLTGGKMTNSELRVFKEASMEAPSEDKLKAMEEMIKKQEENDTRGTEKKEDKDQEIGDQNNEK